MGFVPSVTRDQVEDRISELPDDILLSILPLIEWQQAVKTSILCKRWRYLWAKRSRLDFNHLVIFPKPKPDIYRKTSYTVDETNKYINWVNQVVDLHCGSCIDTFKVWYWFHQRDAHHIDKWVRFAILKRVKHLELSLNSNDPVYTLGFDILKPSLSPSDGDISFLVSLHLKNINVSGDVLEFILSRCPLLERLDVRSSEALVRWKVSGRSCKLKQLRIHDCFNLEELEIDASNLLYIAYDCHDGSSTLLFQNVPLLVDVKVMCYSSSNSILPPISHFAGQISKLSLELLEKEIPGGLLPTFHHLKLLNLLVDLEFDHVAVKTFLEACPALCEFKLEICYYDYVEPEASKLLEYSYMLLKRNDVEDADDTGGSDIDDTVMPQGERKTHPNLKLLHVVGFNGCNADVNLILSLVQYACNLETIICDSSRCLYETAISVYNSPSQKVIEASRSRAAKLMNIVPPKIRIQII